MKFPFIFSFLALLLCGFANKPNPVFFHINAINLSEDMNLLASGNDEIFVFLYSDTDSTSELKMMMEFTFSKSSKKDSVEIDFNIDDITTGVLIEEDSDRSINELEQIVAHHRDSLKTYYHKTQYKKIEKILGDDDVLYIGPINKDTTIIEGIHKVDRYKYLISFER